MLQSNLAEDLCLQKSVNFHSKPRIEVCKRQTFCDNSLITIEEIFHSGFFSLMEADIAIFYVRPSTDPDFTFKISCFVKVVHLSPRISYTFVSKEMTTEKNVLSKAGFA